MRCPKTSIYPICHLDFFLYLPVPFAPFFLHCILSEMRESIAIKYDLLRRMALNHFLRRRQRTSDKQKEQIVMISMMMMMKIMLSKCISTGIHFYLSSYFASNKMTSKVSPLHPSDTDTFDVVRFMKIETRRLSIEFITMLMRAKIHFFKVLLVCLYICSQSHMCRSRLNYRTS